MIPFNILSCVGTEEQYIAQAITSHKICGDGEFTKKCNIWIKKRVSRSKGPFNYHWSVRAGYVGAVVRDRTMG